MVKGFQNGSEKTIYFKTLLSFLFLQLYYMISQNAQRTLPIFLFAPTMKYPLAALLKQVGEREWPRRVPLPGYPLLHPYFTVIVRFMPGWIEQ
jgi:hypothetical protein